MPVHAVTGDSIGGAAIPVYVVSDGRPTLGQPPRRVKVITDADLTINGGNYWIEGRPAAMPVVSVTSGGDEGNVAISVYVVSGSLNPTPYYQSVLATHAANLIAYWPMWEAIGATANDISGNTLNGAYANVVLGAAGIGDGNTSVRFGGVNSRNNIYSAGLAAAFNGAEGSFSIFAKLDAAAWTDGALRALLMLGSDGSNYVAIQKLDTNNTLKLAYDSGGTQVFQTSTLWGGVTGWIHLAITWSDTNNRARFYVNGAQLGAESTITDAWVGALNSTISIIGEFDTGNDFPWLGEGAHAALWSAELTKAEVRGLAANYFAPSAVFFGDSVTGGTGASDAAHRWVNLVASTRGWRVFQNAGVASTTLQNTVQNSVSTVGGAVDNNGRDRYAAAMAAYNPTYALILYGLNDLRLNDAAITEALFENDLGEIVDGLVTSGVPASNIVIGSPPYIPAASYALSPPWDGGSALKHAAYTAGCAAVAAAKGTRYINVYQWMIDHGGDTLVSGDGIHPNDAGHAAIANAFLTVI